MTRHAAGTSDIIALLQSIQIQGKPIPQWPRKRIDSRYVFTDGQ